MAHARSLLMQEPVLSLCCTERPGQSNRHPSLLLLFAFLALRNCIVRQVSVCRTHHVCGN